MRLSPSAARRRRGSTLPLTALLMPFIIALVALSVDLGWIISVRCQMQAAADSAALAGAQQLLNNNYLKGTASTGTATDAAMSAARTAAQKFAAKNYGGGVSLTLPDNANNASTGDIVCGYLATPTTYTQTMTYSQPGVGPYPNSVQVTVRRDSLQNGSLGLFFAPYLGMRSFNLTARATATYEGGINGFAIDTPGYSTCKLLPFALDVNTWNQVLAGSGPDAFTRNAATGAVTAGADGIHECKLYPLSNGNGSGNSGLPPGNFGTVDIGSANNSTADLKRQIQFGPNATDLSYFAGGKLQLDPTTGTLTLQGDTGVSAGMSAALDSIIGQPRIIPLYSSVSGPGNNAQYTIVGFAGVTVLEEVLTGSLSSKHLTIQPCWCIDANALGGSTSGVSYFLVKPLALTR
ncbi:MAG TPA: pilus assembly protein TadG-related protein [Gemmataceae bacterium]|nr:pilus assembly protein TadG-related protein [Gemmataceae bacterium]